MSDQLPPPLESASLAYENPGFLNSPDGRLIRIMAEYAEPLARFRRERIRDTVVFFGSARFRALDVANRELSVAHQIWSFSRVLTAASRRRITNSRRRVQSWMTALPTS